MSVLPTSILKFSACNRAIAGAAGRSPGRTARQAVAAAALLVSLVATSVASHAAATCTKDDFAAAVDQAGASLRDFNKEHGPKVAAAMRELQKQRGWSNSEFEANAINLLHDGRFAALDQKANEMLTRIDTLGEIDESAPPDCSRLPELKQAATSLLVTMREKSELTLAKIAAAKSEAKSSAPAPPQDSTVSEKAAAAKPSSRPATDKPAKPPGSWQAATKAAPPPANVPNDAYRPPAPGAGAAQPGGAEIDMQTLPPDDTDPAEAYTIDEVRDATRGFFGTISANLASVLEYAFSHYGRPTAYVLGTEGGGAFLAGARYGKGKLFMRRSDDRPVYWHGPSIGYDFGAEGSRTLFLIYRLRSPDALFRSYAGVDGSAYVIGGVGLTLLKGGPVLMSPIRTGVGLRLGANIGYIRFTPHATWNPF